MGVLRSLSCSSKYYEVEYRKTISLTDLKGVKKMRQKFTVLDDIIDWLKGRKDWLKSKMPSITTLEQSIPLLTLLTLLATLVMLCLVGWQTNLLKNQTQTLEADFEARSRPYVAIESAQAEPSERGGGDIHLTIENYGTLPAVDVRLSEIDLYWAPPSPDITGNITCTELSEGITICAEQGYVTTPSGLSITSHDRILYPGRIIEIDLPIDEKTYDYIFETLRGKFSIQIIYSSGGGGSPLLRRIGPNRCQIGNIFGDRMA